MRAIGYKVPGAIDRDDALIDVELPEPIAAGRDLLVEVKAVSVNPVDYKVRSSGAPDASAPGGYKVLGFDAAGIVRAVGPDVTLFAPGDEVFYAGSIGRSGTNAQLHLVDERIVGPKPKSLDWSEAAALPLTAITAWEALFDRLDVRRPVRGASHAILIVGGSGGVGSIAIQLARALTNLKVVATASRPETQAWVRELGAHHVVDHSQPLAPQIAALHSSGKGIGAPAFVFATNRTKDHAPQLAELIAPQGRLAVIDTLPEAGLFMRKSVSIHWELMFTRPLFQTDDMIEQHVLLTEVARLVDQRVLKTTLTERLGKIDAANLKKAHRLAEEGKLRGKVALEGWG